MSSLAQPEKLLCARNEICHLILPNSRLLEQEDWWSKSLKRRAKAFGFDMVVVREQTVEYDEAVTFFQQVRRQPVLHKGILKLGV